MCDAHAPRAEVISRYPRPLVEVRTAARVAARTRLLAMADVDDVSLFGTVLHVRGREGVARDGLATSVRRALEGTVPADAIEAIAPSLEDVFVLQGDVAEEVAA